jgi:hypothetical protein
LKNNYYHTYNYYLSRYFNARKIEIIDILYAIKPIGHVIDLACKINSCKRATQDAITHPSNAYQILLDLFCQLCIYIYTIDKRDLEEFGM